MELSYIWKPINSNLPSNLCAKNALLVRDAAHPPLPFTSQGISLAIEDSVVFARTLQTGLQQSSAEAVLKQFVKSRRTIADEFVRGGQQILEDFLRSEQCISLTSYCKASEPEDTATFGSDAIGFSQLSRKAYNYRWATPDSDIIPLTAADSDFAIAQPIQDAMCAYVLEGYMNYGPSKGLLELRSALAQKYSVDPQQVFVTNAAASSMFLVMEHLLTDPGDEVIIADPVDFLFQRGVEAAGGVVRRYALEAPGNERGHWSFDIAKVDSLINDRTKVIGICNPHNPVGRIWNCDELRQLADLAIRHDLKIWSDEVWSDISYVGFEPTLAIGPEVEARTYTVYGFSKGYGLAGLRLGAIIAPSSADIDAISQASLADDTGYSVSVLSQVAGIAALNDAGEWQEAFRKHVEAQFAFAVRSINQIPFVKAVMSQGTFVVFANVSWYLNRTRMNEEDLVEYLKFRARVALFPGSPMFFGPSKAGHIRLAVATSRDVLLKALQRIEKGLKDVLIEYSIHTCA
eukprot:jgi/Psemu1/190910/e_gw1.107.54.1